MFTYLAFVATFFAVINGSLARKPRMAGGEVASISDFPYVVFIEDTVCTGTLISEDIVLTAAHCVPDTYYAPTIRVNSSFSKTGGSLHSVQFFVRHENYYLERTVDNDYVINDIGLLKLASPVVFNGSFQAPALFDANEKIIPGTRGIVRGWGQVPANEKAYLSPDWRYNSLRNVELPILDTAVCNRKLEEDGHVPTFAGEFCAGGATDGKGACFGDSGGPLIVNGKLAGIVSQSFRCDLVQSFQYFTPTIFTEVAYFRNWIDDNVTKLKKQSLINELR